MDRETFLAIAYAAKVRVRVFMAAKGAPLFAQLDFDVGQPCWCRACYLRGVLRKSVLFGPRYHGYYVPK